MDIAKKISEEIKKDGQKDRVLEMFANDWYRSTPEIFQNESGHDLDECTDIIYTIKNNN